MFKIFWGPHLETSEENSRGGANPGNKVDKDGNWFLNSLFQKCEKPNFFQKKSKFEKKIIKKIKIYKKCRLRMRFY